jgi:multidrug efflux pump
MAQFFINRPIFAWVIALFITVIGIVAVTQLPIAQYPPVAPPSIVLSVSYPGASSTWRPWPRPTARAPSR